MSTLPYLPAGQDSLPASRFVIFADSTNQVHRFDESAKYANGTPFESFWESNTLNKQEIGRLYKFLALRLHYSAEDDVNISIESSADGGDTWLSEMVEIKVTTGTRLKTVNIYPMIVGEDLRFRINFDPEIIVNFVGFSVKINREGSIVIGGVS